jgi:hypothetical protein
MLCLIACLAIGVDLRDIPIHKPLCVDRPVKGDRQGCCGQQLPITIQDGLDDVDYVAPIVGWAWPLFTSVVMLMLLTVMCYSLGKAQEELRRPVSIQNNSDPAQGICRPPRGRLNVRPNLTLAV